MAKKTLRLILGDQLNADHSWFQSVDPNHIYLMAEMRQETDYVKHHIQKVVAFFLSMRNFAEQLRLKGHQVRYYQIDDPNNPHSLETLITQSIKEYQADKFEYLMPDEYRLDKQLGDIANNLALTTKCFDTEHFYTERDELKRFFTGKKQLVMESFYRMMRKKHQILMVGNQPEGGQWNYDKSNRKKWKGDPPIPPEKKFHHKVSQVLEALNRADVSTFGNIDPDNFNWPCSRQESESLLTYFCTRLLPHFGDFQDAMHTEEKFLFHSRLSFALNSKMLSPKEVIASVLDTYYQKPEAVSISQAEGFIRQILGWREYMRGIYWMEMPDYSEKNALDNHNKLPDFFWTGNTRMNCLKSSIGQSLEDAYAHHIQRLMIIGNFALLLQVDPAAVDAWYLGVYIDAIEWVEMPNTRGMSQFADGGVVATKPYISSANYIHKMSNYCTGCHYDHRQKTGDKACPFNALYWNFLDEKQEYFQNNHRMAMMLNLLRKKSPEELAALKARAQEILLDPDKF
ncbi:MAG: cryptochrome/photolyase family protein [Eudoraea sp.]|nr:cryptochrome/photolyase family protein [Eudoraea sp.]